MIYEEFNRPLNNQEAYSSMEYATNPNGDGMPVSGLRMFWSKGI